MKSIITIFFAVVSAVLVGTLFIDTQNGKETTATMGNYGPTTAFQIGAFSDKEKAQELAIKYNGIIIQDKEYYLVYRALLSNSINIERMIKYLDDNKIYYYIKVIDISTTLKDNMFKYEELMKNTTSEVAFLQLNKKILEMYGEEYEN